MALIIDETWIAPSELKINVRETLATIRQDFDSAANLLPAAYCELGSFFAQSLGYTEANASCSSGDDRTFTFKPSAVV